MHNSISIASEQISQHLYGVVSLNVSVNDANMELDKIKKSVAATDTLTGSTLQDQFAKSWDATKTHIFPESNFEAKIGYMHDGLMLASAPFSFSLLTQMSIDQFMKIRNKSSSTVLKVYNLIKGFYFFGISSIIFTRSLTRVIKFLSLVKEYPSLSKITALVFPIIKRLFLFIKAMNLIANFIELYQISKLNNICNKQLSVTTIDSDLFKSAFGIEVGKIEILQNHPDLTASQIHKFRCYKVMQTLNNAIDITAIALSPIPFVTPFAALVRVSSLFIKLSLDFWWEKQVGDLTRAFEIPQKGQDPSVSRIARGVSLVALPYMLVPATAPIAGLVIAGAVTADVLAKMHSIKAAA